MYAFGENNESGIRSRQVPVWRGLIGIVLSVINSGPNNYYGIDRTPVCTGSGMYRLHCIYMAVSASGELKKECCNLLIICKHTGAWGHGVFWGIGIIIFSEISVMITFLITSGCSGESRMCEKRGRKPHFGSKKGC